VHLVNGLDGVQVVDTRVEANLVHDNNTCFLGRFFEGSHRGRDVASGDDMSLALDSCLDYYSVVSVRNEGDNEVVGGDSGFKCSCIIDIQRDGASTGKVSSKRFSGFEGTAS